MMKRKLTGVVLAGLALTVSSHSQAKIEVPYDGDSELILVMINQNTANTDRSVFVLDLGIRGYAFNDNLNQSFNLSSNAVYTEWKNTVSSPSNPYFFAIVGGDALGTAANRALWTSSATNSLRGSSSAGTVSNNFVTLTSNVLQDFVSSHNDRVTEPGIGVSTHLIRTNPSLAYDAVTNPYVNANGASYETKPIGPGGASFQASWAVGWNQTFAQVGQKAEFFKVSGVAGGGAGVATIQDFFSATETAANPGGFWSIAGDVLSYTGAPTAPVPEASEWAMMLGGLGLVGFFARRREQKKVA
jgi:hypothetical protein